MATEVITPVLNHDDATGSDQPRHILLQGRPYPLGAKTRDNGTNFAIFSEDATRVDLCLFDPDGRETDRIPLREQTALVWHGFVVGIKPGQLYGYRIDGAWEPEKGHRFNYNKLLIDPYAEAISGTVDWQAPVYPYDISTGDDMQFDERDSASGVPKCVVVEHAFDWGDDCPPATPLADSVIYEVHVKGFSIRNPKVPEHLRGTYAGLAHESSIQYLKELGVTAVELSPVHHFVDDGHLVEKGLSNYWGYNTLGSCVVLRRPGPFTKPAILAATQATTGSAFRATAWPTVEDTTVMPSLRPPGDCHWVLTHE